MYNSKISPIQELRLSFRKKHAWVVGYTFKVPLPHDDIQKALENYPHNRFVRIYIRKEINGQKRANSFRNQRERETFIALGLFGELGRVNVSLPLLFGRHC